MATPNAKFPAFTHPTRIAVGRLERCPHCNGLRVIMHTVLSPQVETFCTCAAGATGQPSPLLLTPETEHPHGNQA